MVHYSPVAWLSMGGFLCMDLPGWLGVSQGLALGWCWAVACLRSVLMSVRGGCSYQSCSVPWLFLPCCSVFPGVVLRSSGEPV